MANATTLKLVRHATHDQPANCLCGRMPGVALSAAGHGQLPWLADRLGTAAAAAVYASPQHRCQQTAAALGLPVATLPGLDEIDFGAWTGQTFDALQHQPSWRAWNADRDHGQAPGGESAATALARIAGCANALCRRHPGTAIVLVTHGDIIKSLITHHLGLPLQAYLRIEITQASITTLRLGPSGATLLGLNDTA